MFVKCWYIWYNVKFVFVNSYTWYKMSNMTLLFVNIKYRGYMKFHKPTWEFWGHCPWIIKAGGEVIKRMMNWINRIYMNGNTNPSNKGFIEQLVLVYIAAIMRLCGVITTFFINVYNKYIQWFAKLTENEVEQNHYAVNIGYW